MRYWLFKSEPSTFSIEDLKNRPKQTEHWDGVRNYQVRNLLRDEIKVGDLAFFYHSSCTPPGVAGIVEVVKDGYPDFTQFDPESKYYDPRSTAEKPRWFMVNVKFVEAFSRLVTLEEMRKHPKLQKMKIMQRGNRLSITTVTSSEWDVIVRMGNGSRQ